jgi:tRNA-dihydrouridine synthase
MVNSNYCIGMKFLFYSQYIIGPMTRFSEPAFRTMLKKALAEDFNTIFFCCGIRKVAKTEDENDQVKIKRARTLIDEEQLSLS